MSGEPRKPEPTPDPGPGGDPPTYGICQWGKHGHPPVQPIWLLPRFGRWYCREHLYRVIRMAWWKS